MAVVLKLNLLHVSSSKMCTFCDVLYETKQKRQTNSWECTVLTGIISAYFFTSLIIFLCCPFLADVIDMVTFDWRFESYCKVLWCSQFSDMANRNNINLYKTELSTPRYQISTPVWAIFLPVIHWSLIESQIRTTEWLIFISWVHTGIICRLHNSDLVAVDLSYFIQLFLLSMMQTLASLKVHLDPKYLFCSNKSLHLFEMHCAFLPLFNTNLDLLQAVEVMKSGHHLSHDRASKGYGSIPGLTSQTSVHACLQRLNTMQISLWHQTRNRPMPLTSLVMRQMMARFRNFYNLKKSQDLE